MKLPIDDLAGGSSVLYPGSMNCLFSYPLLPEAIPMTFIRLFRILR
jgi:hypothetical protein